MRLPKTKTLDELIKELTALRASLGGDTPCYIFNDASKGQSVNMPLTLSVTQSYFTEDYGPEDVPHPFIDFQGL